MKGWYNMLKSEKAMSRLELVITVASIMFIAACTIVLLIGENGLSFLPKEEVQTQTVNEIKKENELNNTISVDNVEILPGEEQITQEIENIIEDV